MRRWTWNNPGPVLVLLALLVASLAVAPRAWAQGGGASGGGGGGGSGGSLADRLNLDRLHLTAIGLAYGSVAPSQVVQTSSYGIEADYGEIAPHWHVVFSASYWGSRFTDAAVARFVSQLRNSIVDPTGDDTIVASPVHISDITLEADGRWSPAAPRSFFAPYIGGGIGANIVNAESKMIDHTFVESALDNIATGLTALTGFDLRLARALSIGVEARYTLLSTVRFGTLRATVSYHFGPSALPVATPATGGTP